MLAPRGKWISLSMGLTLVVLYWINTGSLGWGQSPTPDLNSIPPQDRIIQPAPVTTEIPSSFPNSEPSPEPETIGETDPQNDDSTSPPIMSRTKPRLAPPGIIIQQLGNLHYSTVSLDGYRLIEVAAKIPEDERGSPETELPIYRRVEEIHNRLKRAVSQSIRSDGHLGQLEIANAILNNEVVLIMRYGERRPVVLLTVTQADAELASTTIDELADEWEIAVRSGLIRAWEERQQTYIREQLRWSGICLIINILLTVFLRALQKQAKSLWDGLQQQAQDMIIASTEITEPSEPDLNPELGFVKDQEELTHLRREQDLLVLLRRSLAFGQILNWFLGLTLIMTRFPQARELGLSLFGLPFFIILLLVIILLLSRVLKLLVDYHFSRWLEDKKSGVNDATRASAQAETYVFIFRDVINDLRVIFFLAVLLYVLEVPLNTFLTGASLFGIFLSLSAQSMIKNLLAGVGLLIEDQYALRDWVTINDSVCGVVEHIDLIYTKIRDMNGSVVTIANGQIQKVENMTVDWARVPFEIDVAYQTDIDQAIQILKQESITLSKDPQWRSRILDPVELVGVDRVAHDGMGLRLWIQTQAGWQWAVERELRRRLRIAFEKHEISIGIPQQEIPQLSRISAENSSR